MDLGLPDMDGIEVIRNIRSWSNLPIIVISARSEDSDKIDALDAGADDYLTKPFSVEELLARLRVTQRRLSMMVGETETSEDSDKIDALDAGADDYLTKPFSVEELLARLRVTQRRLSMMVGETETPVFQNGDLKIDYSAGCAWIGSEELHLTPIEYKILCLLAQNVGRVLTHTYITQHVWGHSWDNDISSLRVFMATLRKKLENGEDSPQYIQTHIGVGYRMIRV